jgi:hypothetical protein
MTNNILTDIQNRNGLRARASLPLLDVEAEYHRQMSVSAGAVHRAAWQTHRAEREAIRRSVIAEHRSKRPEFPTSLMGHWLLAAKVDRIFRERLQMHETDRP